MFYLSIQGEKVLSSILCTVVCVVIGCGCATDDYIEMIGTANLSKTV